MPKYLTFHSEPDRKWEDLEQKYVLLAKETTAVWIRTYLREHGTKRVCEWDAPSPETLHVIFERVGITCYDIEEVEEILPARWR